MSLQDTSLTALGENRRWAKGGAPISETFGQKAGRCALSALAPFGVGESIAITGCAYTGPEFPVYFGAVNTIYGITGGIAGLACMAN